MDQLGSALLQKHKLLSDKNDITVFYSASENKQRAIEIRNLLEEAIQFYQTSLAIDHRIDVAVLNQADWKTLVNERIPYGMPHIVGPKDRQVAVLPANDQGVVTVGAIHMKEYLPKEDANTLASYGMSFEEGASTYTDIIAIHELGHSYAQAYGIKPLSAWSGEFLASFFAYAFLQEKHPKLAKVFEIYAYQLNVNAPGPTDRSLLRLEKLYAGVGADDYVWYQGMFVHLVVELYKQKELDVLREFKSIFGGQSDRIAGPPKTESDEKIRLRLDQEFDRLSSISPFAKTWRSRHFVSTDLKE
ncbi:hypothetical protein NBRC116587_09960 [Pseudoteredinibacter isoporae]